ncbi:hypothetical protein R1sor_000809 [Riccia sorocarpa]|uniref:Uncharacterized protein n=1 Tax=Riccia sorocarpa TaxID=122646 RepID=A0ABD3GU58_9MARC
MKMTAAAPIVPLYRTSSSENDTPESPRSIFASVLSAAKRKPVSEVPVHGADSDQIRTTSTDAFDGTPEVRPIITTIKTVAVSSSHPESPAFQGIESTQKPYHKLRSRIFKCHKRRNLDVTDPDSGSTGEEGSATDQLEGVEASTPETHEVLAVSSSQPESPTFQGAELELTTQKPHHKLRSRIFKCHRTRNVDVMDPDSGSGEEGSAMDQPEGQELSTPGTHEESPEVTNSNSNSNSNSTLFPELPDSTDSPKVGGRFSAFLKRRKGTDHSLLESTDSPRSTTDSPRKRLAFIRRRSIPKSSAKESEPDGLLSAATSATESEIEEAVSQVVADKLADPVIDKKDAVAAAVAVAGGETKVSRSQELKMRLRNFKKRYKHQENLPTSDEESQRLDVTTVKELDVNRQTNTILGNKEEKKIKSCLSHKSDSDKSRDKGAAASSSTTIPTTSRLNNAQSSNLSRTSSAFNNSQPKATTLAIQERGFEVGSMLDSEISGTFLVLAILGFLLVGKTTAILCTACLCIVISRVQQVRAISMTPRQQEELALSRKVRFTGVSRPGGSPLHSYGGGDGSPAIDVYSTDYRKKIHGFLSDPSQPCRGSISRSAQLNLHFWGYMLSLGLGLGLGLI